MKTFAIYARISQDRAGTQAGVNRQIDDCQALAKRDGLMVLDRPFVDNDISASSGKRRPAWEEVLRLVEEGTIQGIISWHNDRLYRTADDLQRLVKVAENGVLIRTVTAGDIDLNQVTGRLVAGLVAQVSTYEIDHKIERSLSKSLATAEDGGFHGGPIPMGYRRGPTVGTIEKDPDAAFVLREAARRLLADHSLSEVTEWTRQQLGRDKLKPVSLKAALTRHTIIGVRRHVTSADRVKWNKRRALGEVSGEPDKGFEHKAQWEPILTVAEWDQLRAKLLNDRRKKPGRPTKHLLSGILICELCGGRLGYSTNAYKCSSSNGGGCAGLAISTRNVEAVVTSLMEAGLAPTVSLPATEPPGLDGSVIAELDNRKRVFIRLFRNGHISEEELDADIKSIDQQLAHLEREDRAAHELAEQQRASQAFDIGKWRNADVHQRRRMIKAAFPDGITIFKSPRGQSSGAKFDPSRVYFGPPPWDDFRLPEQLRKRYRQDQDLRRQGIAPEPWSSPVPNMTSSEKEEHEAAFDEARRQFDEELGWS